MTQTVITWGTQKTETGAFRFQVIAIGYQIPTEVLKEGVLPTRARAVGRAKAWMRHLNAQRRRVGAEG